MRVQLDRMHFPVTTLGPGRRLGLWFQGCTLACPGCLSRDTWDPDGGAEITIDDLVDSADRLCQTTPDGITISGGEPFQQPKALAAVVTALRAWGATRGTHLDVLAYTGLPFERLRRDHADVLAILDAVIPEPYEAARPPSGPWRGSGNQPLVLLTELGAKRFAEVGIPAPSMQVAVHQGVLWMIGVPRTGDLSRLEAGLRSRGIELDQVSWRP